MKYFPIRSVIFAVMITSLTPLARAAVYQETNGVVVVEAEHFDKRVADPADATHTWKIIPDEDPGTGDAQNRNARGNKYIQSLPDAGQNKNTDATVVGTGPYVEYKVAIIEARVLG